MAASRSDKVVFWILCLLTVWVGYDGLFTQQLSIVPSGAQRVPEALLVLLGMWILLRGLARKNALRGQTIKYMWLFVLTAIASVLLNHTPALNFLVGTALFVVYYLVYLLIKNADLSKNEIQVLYRAFLFIAFTGIPIALYQYFGFARSTENWDRVIGPFFSGDANLFAYFCGFAIFFILMRALTTRKAIRAWYILFMVAMLIPYFLCSGKSAYFLFPAAILGMAYGNFTKNFGKLFLVVALFVGGFYVVNVGLYGASISRVANIDANIQGNLTFSSENMGRIALFFYSQHIMDASILRNVVGIGPGTFGSLAAMKLGSQFQTGLWALIGHTNLVESDFVNLRAEFGYLGLLFFGLLIYKTYLEAAKIPLSTRKAKWALGAFRASLIYFMFGAFFENIWETQMTAFFFWLLAGLYYAMIRAEWIRSQSSVSPNPQS